MPIDLAVDKISKRFGDYTAVEEVSFEVPQGHFFSILGPSGCGKTTLLRMIAGFTAPSEGVIAIRGRDMQGVVPNRRPVNMIFQHLALFPMMTVGQNIAFGLERRREKRDVIQRKVARILERVGLPGFEAKKIDQLSGGQQQRVAVARCLVLEPAVLLLDEPLGALDLKLREQMKVELKTLQAQVGTTFVYITHDQSEALVMSDAVAVMNQGRFEQVGAPQSLYHHPQSAFVARFVGENNAWMGRVRGGDVTALEIDTDDGRCFVCRAAEPLEAGMPVELFIRPEALLIEPDKGIADLNRFEVQVRAILFDGANSRLLARPANADNELLIALPQNRQYDHIRVDDRIEVGWAPTSGICFAAS
ncbi:MAG: ABC transporter ATP-binding protein [Desulfobacterales bacterium]|nr:ABC transporter ATP-binding protein [Desulfobacterales bacterium]